MSENTKPKFPRPAEIDKKARGPAKRERERPTGGYKFIDLFAGMGGMRLGFEAFGNECVFSSEWDPHSQKTYEANFGERPYGDITKIKDEEIDAEIPDFDILLAGFPCQPFSTIGLRQGFDHPTQGTLFHNIEKILEAKRPSAFLLENVPGLVNHDGGNTYEVIMQTLIKTLGYHVDPWILDSQDFGVPQSRSRLYLVGFDKILVGKKFSLPLPLKFPQKNYIAKHLEEGIEGYSISKHLQHKYLNKKKDGRPQKVSKSKSKAEQIVVKTLVSTYHKIQRLTGTFVEDGPTGLRLLTEAECKAIMGFPKNFKVPVSRTQMYRQFGNSVAVPVIEEIARVMTAKLNELLKQKNRAVKNGRK